MAEQRGDREPVGQAADEPGLRGSLQQIRPPALRQGEASQRQCAHQHQQAGSEGTVPHKGAPSLGVRIGLGHAALYIVG
jgi:hypothetical protein